MVSNSRDILDPQPFKLKIDVDGELVEVKAAEEFGAAVVAAAKPVTEYGYTKNREDSAESFVPYVHTDSSDTEALDPIRRRAITALLQRIGTEREYGPRLTTITRIDPQDVVQIKPDTIEVKQVYSVKLGGSNDSVRSPVDITDSNNWYRQGSKRNITDDYGNQISVTPRQPRNF